ncbi:MAG: GNAT family N-acetyltransferase [Candidatus Methylomirabilales bacterium]
MKIQEDSWLSEIFGYPVFRVEPGDERAAVPLGDVVRNHESRHSSAMYYAKIDADRIETVRELSGAGFYVVDVNVTFGMPATDGAGRGKAADFVRHTIREIAPEDHEAVLRIAATCFRYSRFHLDPLIPASVANRIKHDWILNYIKKQRGEQLWVALHDARPAGFLAVFASDAGGRRTRTIDLIGVDSAVQGRGFGASLVAFFIDRYAGVSDYLQVGTQVANIPSMKLYQKFGFAIVRTQYVMHKHVHDTRGGSGTQ